MQRRSFLKFLLSTPLAAVIDYEQLLWVPGEKTIFIPEPTITQVELYDMILEVPLSLMGVPYHLTDGTTRTWLGFEREAPVEYKKITLSEAIQHGHIRPYEVDSISKFVKENNNA